MGTFRKLLLMAVACAVLAPAAFAEPEMSAGSLSQEEIASRVKSALDTSADPCQNFYRYACGGWLDNTERPADEARWTRSFSVIREENRQVIRDILESAKADPGDDPDRQKIGYYYGSCMDEATVEERGAEPLKPLFAKIAKISDAESLLAVAGKLHRIGVNTIFGGGVFPDFKNPDLDIAWFFQGGLGLPDRDYYVSDDPKKQELLAEYQAHVSRMLGLLGDENAEEAAARIVAFETELAKISRPAQEMRDFERLYNKIDVQGLQELTPNLPWNAYFDAIGYPEIADLSVATPEFFERLEELAGEGNWDDIHAYLRWNVVNEFAAHLSSNFVNADFDFYGKTLSGQQEIRPRWKRCVGRTAGALGEVIGKQYVKQRFAGSSKEVALEMIADIEKAFEGNLPDLSWMDDATRARAMEKVGTLQNKIGYPDEWRDYSAMELKENDYFANVVAADSFEFDRQSRKVGKPVDRNEWGMAPQAVNAYYNPLWNEIAFPAGILQPPFFHRDQPAPMNYGAIGGVIGHELTHGFDDQGRKFDPKGRLNEWWAPEVAGRFESQAQCVENYYADYEVAPGAKVNGTLTLGENIADIGGVKEAYTAYKAWEARHEADESFIEGISNDQLFFLSWAQGWCTLASEEYERMQVTVDPHSPAKFRVLGPLSNTPAFAAAFQCEAGTPMNPEQRCLVW